jgi:SAM-dependent methyltransferase
VQETQSGQARDTAEQNAEFFARDTYARQVDELDSYRLIRAVLNRELAGANRLLDVGNGGVFEYDLSVAEHIVAVDLFFEEHAAGTPANVTFRRGDALALEEQPESFDVAIHAYLYHHLTGVRARDSLANVRTALGEARRMLAPGGRLVIAESCVPAWFYRVEQAVYPIHRAVAKSKMLGGHPATMHLPVSVLESLVAEQFEVERSEKIELGRWLSQFGRRWPTLLTPVNSRLIIARRPA